jgi:hypothetical protein
MDKVPEYTIEVMLAIARLLPPELRGPYGDTNAPSQDRTLKRPSDLAPLSPKSAGDGAEDIATN